ncbi:unnamed protein product [Thlaspi arvense]|uniref:Non-specific lipid-transfer protein n=1 Tax=Thlaspi arvense TaxID=13288 RepID=A0AAU9S033_THLAR|nr:unnamed protein product [Thlaspi arvense]
MAAVKIACLALCIILVAAPASEAAIGCGQVVGSLSQCLNYLRGGATAVPPACCSGVRSLNSMATTRADRQVVCNCLKSAASSVPASGLSKAAGIPGKCGVSIPYKISPSIDCSK